MELPATAGADPGSTGAEGPAPTPAPEPVVAAPAPRAAPQAPEQPEGLGATLDLEKVLLPIATALLADLTRRQAPEQGAGARGGDGR